MQFTGVMTQGLDWREVRTRGEDMKAAAIPRSGQPVFGASRVRGILRERRLGRESMNRKGKTASSVGFLAGVLGMHVQLR